MARRDAVPGGVKACGDGLGEGAPVAQNDSCLRAIRYMASASLGAGGTCVCVYRGVDGGQGKNGRWEEMAVRVCAGLLMHHSLMTAAVRTPPRSVAVDRPRHSTGPGT